MHFAYIASRPATAVTVNCPVATDRLRPHHRRIRYCSRLALEVCDTVRVAECVDEGVPRGDLLGDRVCVLEREPVALRVADREAAREAVGVCEYVTAAVDELDGTGVGSCEGDHVDGMSTMRP